MATKAYNPTGQSYNFTAEYGWVGNEDGWVQSLYPARSQIEEDLISLPICRHCGLPQFHLMANWDSRNYCTCEAPEFPA